MKKYLPIAASVLLMAACSEKPSYEITGTVSADANGKYVYLYNYPYSEEAVALDSALVENGTFSLKGAAVAPELCVLVNPAAEGKAAEVAFILENARLSANLGAESSVTGSVENDAYNQLHQELRQLNSQLKQLTADMKSEDATVVADAEKKYEALEKEATAKSKAYIEANLSSKLAALVFSDNRYNLTEEEQNNILAKADAAFKAVPGIDKMIKHLEILKNSAVGKKFIDFEMADPKGKMHKLSEYVGNGKVVLIDFWASWCPPCRREMPNLVKAHKEYKSKGFDIIGISLDSKADAWEKGVKDLGITWPQLSDLKGWKNSGAALYGVNSIPHTILVDKDGTILAKNLHGDELEAKLKEVLK